MSQGSQLLAKELLHHNCAILIAQDFAGFFFEVFFKVFFEAAGQDQGTMRAMQPDFTPCCGACMLHRNQTGAGFRPPLRISDPLS